VRFCHGAGNLTTDGCCYVDGAVCPLRLKIVNDHVFDAAGADLGTVDAVVRQYAGNNPQRQLRVRDQLQGVVYVCRAAVDVIVADASLLNDRPAFNAAWIAHAEYQSLVRPAWARLEQANGWAPGSYQCATWTGTGVAQCCFAEDEATNAAKSADLSTSAVTIRRAGGRP
jgi:hypothetical protein